MTLHPEWRALVARAWSIRFMAAGALSGFTEGFVQAYTSGWLSALPSFGIGLLSAAGGVARVLAQKNLPDV